MLTKTLASLTLAASLVACVQQSEAPSEIQQALPTAEQVQIKLPGAAARQLGQLADWYVATRNVTRMFNGGSAWVLVLIHTIVQFPVTSTSGDVYTWGPWSDALDPAEYKLDVRALSDGTYSYKLSGRSRTQPGAQFEVVIDGTADPRPGDDRGKGMFLLDFEAGRRVNPIDADDARGKISVNYDLAARTLDLGLESIDEQGRPVLGDYAYTESPSGGGDMTFQLRGDAGGSTKTEELTLRSRWLATGAGRADARIADGDLGPTGAVASECWDTAFKRVYYTDSVAFKPTEGTPAACAFATPDLPPVR
jgi:hypothetical protein